MSFNRLEDIRRQRSAAIALMDRDAEARRAKAAKIVAAMERQIALRRAGRRINNIIIPPGWKNPATQ